MATTLNAVKFKDINSFNKNKNKANVKASFDSHKIIVFEDTARVTPNRAKVSHVHPVNNLVEVPTDEVIIYAKDFQKTLDDLKKQGIRVKKSFPQTGTIIAVMPEHTPFTNIHSSITSNRGVESAHQDHIFITQHNGTDFSYNDTWQLPALRCQEGWALIPPGPDNYVAVFDTACETAHPDLVGWLYDNYNHATNTPNVEPTAPDEGHGTSCSGIICANPTNGIDTIGVAGPRTKVTFQSIGIWLGGGQFSSSASWQVAAVNYVIQNPTCVAISMSYGGGGAVGDARDQVFAKARLYGRGGNASTSTPGLGTLCFAASGNNGQANLQFFPAYYPSVISIGATDINQNKASFSNYGTKLSMSAPGVRTPTSDLTGTAGYNLTTNPSSDTSTPNGTSFACPIAAGVAAAIAAANDTLTADQIEDIMKLTCNKIGTYDYNYDVSVPGKSFELGYGQVDLYAAVSLATSGTIPPGPIVLPDLRVVVSSATSVTVGNDLTINYTLSLNTILPTDTTFDVEIFYSSDPIYDPSDTVLATVSATIPAGSFFTQDSYTFTVPNTISGNTYFGVFADSTNVIDPEPELNNVGFYRVFVNAPVVPTGLNLAVEIQSLLVDSVTGVATVKYNFKNTGATTITNFKIRKGFDGLKNYEYTLVRTLESLDILNFEIPWTDIPDPANLFTTVYRIEILEVNGIADDDPSDNVDVILPDIAVPTIVNP